MTKTVIKHSEHAGLVPPTKVIVYQQSLLSEKYQAVEQSPKFYY